MIKSTSEAPSQLSFSSTVTTLSSAAYIVITEVFTTTLGRTLAICFACTCTASLKYLKETHKKVIAITGSLAGSFCIYFLAKIDWVEVALFLKKPHWQKVGLVIQGVGILLLVIWSTPKIWAYYHPKKSLFPPPTPAASTDSLQKTPEKPASSTSGASQIPTSDTPPTAQTPDSSNSPTKFYGPFQYPPNVPDTPASTSQLRSFSTRLLIEQQQSQPPTDSPDQTH